MKFEGKKIAVLGFGVEGKSVLRFLENKASHITVFEEQAEDRFEKSELDEFRAKGVKFVFGPFTSFLEYHLIFRSPGIKLNRPELEEAQKKGIEITSAIKVFFDECAGKIIGVTGTKGKGTTSTLIYEMLKAGRKDVFLGGNIGNPPLEFLNEVKPDSWVVLELSSFQLQDLTKSPHIAVILMTTSEHLDYHTDVYEYIDAKRNIVRFQTSQDFAILNKDYPASNESDIYTQGTIYKVSREQDVEQGCFVRNEKIYLKMSEHEEEILLASEVALPGKHNLENICAAIVAATFAKTGMKAITQVAKTFKGLPHRLELIRTVQGVRYYNDSFSTTPETAIAAIEAFSDPKVVILGGSHKGSDFAELGAVISASDSIKAVIGIGEEWNVIKPFIESPKLQLIEGCTTMQEVVIKASEVAILGDVVLLSPACASFGMFKNYKDRGEQFRKAVEAL
jgi:UDP-N-acetylmuramoylalanine--D-glutamate ligase